MKPFKVKKKKKLLTKVAPFVGCRRESMRSFCSPQKKAFAKRLRQNPTRAEYVLWQYLRGRRVNGLKFRRQSLLYGYIADFYCPSKMLIVEIDGSFHDSKTQKEYDTTRTKHLEQQGFLVLRYTNQQVIKHPKKVCEDIWSSCKDRVARPKYVNSSCYFDE